MKYCFWTSLLFLFVFQPVQGQLCQPPAIVANANSRNLFTPEQETVLGNLTVERTAREFRHLRDPQLLAYVETIGEKIIKHLPPTGLKYHFHIIDYPEANAFNIPGGHVFITRKLIAFVNSEDELAGVIGHELGHATVRHGALDISESMRKILKVSSLGDDKDVAEKFNLLIENARTKRISQSRGHEDDQQLEADKIGFYAMVAAGYDPAAMFTFFDRLTESEGKTGSWFSEIFGGMQPEQKRLREIAQATEQLPKECRDGRVQRAPEDFRKWQADIVMYHEGGGKESLPSLMWRRDLSPKLRSDIKHFAFSADGKLLIAQDDFSISVIDRGASQVLLEIPAGDADNASFTPDGKQVVFATDNLRFERWDIAEKKAVEARELVVRRDCWEHSLSPDGNFLACVDRATTVNILDTKTGKKLWEKKEFYPLDYFEYLTWITAVKRDTDFDVGFFRIRFSPDSRYVMFSRSNKYRYRFSVNGMTMGGSENTAMAVDLSAMKQIDIGGDLKKIAARPYDFLDSGRVVGTTEPKLAAGGIFSFPGGKRIQKLEIGGEEVDRTANSDYVVVKPVANADAGLLDIRRDVIVGALKKKDLTVWNNLMAIESVSGKILLREIAYNEAAKALDAKDAGTVDLPAALIGDAQSVEVSDNFNWLMFSSKTRGGLWDLGSGERKIFTRGFKSSVIDQQGTSVADFPKFRDDSHSLALLSAKSGQSTSLRDLPEFGAKQYGRFILTRRGIKESSDKKGDTAKSQFPMTDEDQAELKLRRDVTFELKDWTNDKIIWTKDFEGYVPRFSVDSYSGRLMFYWRLSSEEGKKKLKENPALRERTEALGDTKEDYLIEVIDAYQQKPVGIFPLETGKGSFEIGSGQSEGDWVMLRDNEGRVLIYSLKDGTLRYRYFGNRASISPSGKQIIVENFPGELTLYDLDTGKRAGHFVINGKVVFVRFNLKSDRLFVLSSAQTAYAFDLSKLPEPDDRLAVAQ